MFKHLPFYRFVKKFTRNLLIGIAVIAICLGLGMGGYHHFEKMSWVDAYVNAAMILSGMGPVVELKTTAGKIFAGSYALFSGIVFLFVIALIFAPIVHRFLHKFHMEEKDQAEPQKNPRICNRTNLPLPVLFPAHKKQIACRKNLLKVKFLTFKTR